MKVYSQLKIPTLLAATLSCLMLAGCGTDSKPTLPTDNGSDTGGSTGGGTDNTNENDITFIVLNQSYSEAELVDGNVTIYDNSSDTSCEHSSETCGAFKFSVTISEFEVIPKLTKDKPATVKYTLSSPNGNVADILKDPSQVSGTLDLHGILKAEGINNPSNRIVTIPLKEDALKDGNWIVTVTLSEPTNPLGKAELGKSNTVKYTVVDATNAVMARVNDTGVTYTGKNPKGNHTITNDGDATVDANKTVCDPTMTSKQDCNTGRDAMYPPTDAANNTNGWAGFDFTKVSATGEDLPVTATDWSCVRDNVTGKVWERKTYTADYSARDYRDVQASYAYYDSATGLGEADLKGYGSCALPDGAICNTENYTATLNKDQLCGISNWRLPSRNEIYDIINLNGVNKSEMIHTDWFLSNSEESNLPNFFWTNSIAIHSKYQDPYAFDALWLVSPGGTFDTEQPKGYFSANTNYVIAVSDAQQ